MVGFDLEVRVGESFAAWCRRCPQPRGTTASQLLIQINTRWCRGNLKKLPEEPQRYAPAKVKPYLHLIFDIWSLEIRNIQHSISINPHLVEPCPIPMFYYWMNFLSHWVQPISTFWIFFFNWIVLKTDKWINFWIEFCRRLKQWINVWFDFIAKTWKIFSNFLDFISCVKKMTRCTTR